MLVDDVLPFVFERQKTYRAHGACERLASVIVELLTVNENG